MKESSTKIYTFGDYSLKVEDGTLWHGTERISVTQKSVEMLTLLLENRGRVVTRDEIIERLWPDTFVDENNLSVTVSMLRKAFGENKGEPKFIETIPRKGYRFMADATESDGALVFTSREYTRTVIERTEIDDGATTDAIAQLRSGARRQNYILVVLGIFTVLLIVTIGWNYYRGDGRDVFASRGSRTIAVLPFRNLSRDESGTQFSLGLTDALITKLAGLSDLTVRPTSSVVGFTDSAPTLPEVIKEKLKVGNYVDGTIQHENGRLRVSVQLVQVSDGSVVWAETFEESVTELLRLQDLIAVKVFAAMRIEVSPKQKEMLARRESKNGEANALYLKGRYYWNRRSSENIKKAVEYFEQAVEKDPTFALGFIGVSDGYQMFSEYGGIERKVAMEKARTAVLRAIELNGDLGEAYCSLGYLQAFYDWDFPAAEASFRKAIELSPNYATAHQWYGELLIAQDRIDESIERIKRAIEIDPVSPIILTDLASSYYVARRFDDAIKTAKEVEELSPNFPMANYFLAFCYAQKGMDAETKKSYYVADKTWLPGLTNSDESAYTLLSLKDLYLRRYRDATTSPVSKYLNGYQKAMNAVLAHDFEGVFRWLEISLESRDRWFVNLAMDPIWDPIRTDPRFNDLLQRSSLKK